jgi:acyl-CoA reductase-like NAD-dependent aldehyde dehydrogenase
MTNKQTMVSADTVVHGNYIAGRWTDPDARTFDDFDPYSGDVYARISAGGPDEARRAVAAADAAFPAWAALTPAEKQRLFLRAAAVVDERRAEIAETMARETGCTLPFADFQQDLVMAMLQHAAQWVYLPKGEVLQSDVAGTLSMTVRRPLGVVASFTPWNGANVLAWRAALLPLAAGNTVVMKPSEEAPISAGLIVAEIAEAAGFPPGVLNVVAHAPGEAGPIADVFFDSDEVRCINFIGSVPTGRMLAERAGRTLKRTVMELGGYNPMIVLADADLEYAVDVATFSAFLHQGQVCLNARKILVEDSLYDRFVERFTAKTRSLPVGDPREPSTVLGPLINDRARDMVHARVTDALTRGATLVTGGEFTGRVYQPTILVDVPEAATVSQEETFGPVVIVQRVRDADEALQIVNQSLYGLTSSIISGDTFRAMELAAQIKSGAVHVNIPTVDDEIQSPVGGVRDSGWGRSGPHAMDDFTDLVWINAQSGKRTLPF